MASLILSLIVIGLGLGVLFYVGGMFFQGYIYTEPSPGLYWQAPAAASVIFLFLLVWCLMTANSSTASLTEVPYDALFRFYPKEDMVKKPVKELTAVYKNGTKVEYVPNRNPTGQNRYVEKKSAASKGPESGAKWNSHHLKEIRLTHEGQEMVFELRETGPGANREFVHSASGYTIVDFAGDGPNGIPWVFRWGRFLFTLFLNFFHLVLWFLCFWLLLRFQWGHALGLAFVMWLIFTLVILPMFLDNAGQVAMDKRAPQRSKTAARVSFLMPPAV